ncbi:MAG: DUF2029 domain-containing protein [Chloroflexi bacterium]|nr:DUF2029 domain-containing protein [Chloroflexota bacterium]
MQEKKSWRQVGLGLLALVGLIALVLMPQPLPAHLLKFDFQAYWGASYLLGHSQNFSDPDLLLEVQQTFTGRQDETAQMTWNPPWLLVLFLPYTWLPFAKASWIWFLTNLGLLFASVVLLWRLFASQEKTDGKIGWGFAVAFLFMPTLATILVGQITALVLFGLAGFLFFECNERPFDERPFAAGLALSLTTIKPHLVYITLPLIVIEMLRRKQWRFVVGLVAFPALGTIITFVLRPSFLSEYFSTVTGSSLLQRTVPTIGYVLGKLFNWPGFLLMGIVILPLAVIWLLRRKPPVDLFDLTAVTLLISIMTAPYGWSFDIIVLLVPILRLLVWMVEGQLNRLHVLGITAMFIIVNALIIYIRKFPLEDDIFFWVAPVLALLYGWGWQNRQKSAQLAVRSANG